ncbi:MAG: hypothetical protein ABI780_01330 [Ardenticatenales bacterium]
MTCAPNRSIALCTVAAIVGAATMGWLLPSPPASRAAMTYAQWSAPSDLADGGWQAEADATSDALGAVHVVWTAPIDGPDGATRTAISYSVFERNGWTPPERIPCGPENAHCSEPAIAVDAIGWLHVAYVRTTSSGSDIVHRMRPASASPARWSPAEVVSAGRSDALRSDPAIAADHIGNVHVAWCDRGGGSPDVLYRQRLLGGTWRDVTAVHDPLAGAQTHPAFALAPNGTLHAVWIDNRDGAPAVWTSLLPERAFVWWPDAPLSAATGGIAGPPALAAAKDGAVTAVWAGVDDDGGRTLRMARFPPGGPYWEPSRRLPAGENGAVLDVAAAAAPDGAVALAWTEARPGDRVRLYSGRIGSAAVEERTRVDGTIRFPVARHPALVIDARGRALLAWEQAQDPGAPTVRISVGQLPEPEREWRAVEGFLSYDPSLFGCQADGFRVTACDGGAAATLLSDDARLPALVGAYVSVEGWVIPDAGCARLTAERFSARTPPCDRAASSAIGRLWRDGVPLRGGRVFVGSTIGLSGRSGRFGFSGLPAATNVVTATAPCALTASAGPVTLQPRQRLDLGPVAFVRGDVVPDCVIDVRDLARVAWDMRRPIDEIDACSDVNGDGIVNVADLDRVRERLGLRCPMPWSPTPAPPTRAFTGGANAP